MISGIFHKGSGLGNQLHRYIATRVLALDKGYDFGMMTPKHFKGGSFMNLDMGKFVNRRFVIEERSGRTCPVFDVIRGIQEDAVWQELTNYYNPEFNFIEDNTIIDGEFQDEMYFEHHLDKIDGWLRWTEVPAKPQGKCVIGFRGGEYYAFPELGLPKSYFDEGIRIMREINPDMEFEVQTDDPELAREFFPDFEIIHDIKYNWGAMRVAKYAIIANTSFCILPRLLLHHFRDDVTTIAPRYWARYNTRTWSMPQNFYKDFTYIHHEKDIS